MQEEEVMREEPVVSGPEEPERDNENLPGEEEGTRTEEEDLAERVANWPVLSK